MNVYEALVYDPFESVQVKMTDKYVFRYSCIDKHMHNKKHNLIVLQSREYTRGLYLAIENSIRLAHDENIENIDSYSVNKCIYNMLYDNDYRLDKLFLYLAALKYISLFIERK